MRTDTDLLPRQAAHTPAATLTQQGISADRQQQTETIVEGLTRAADPAQAAQLRNELVLLHLPVARSIAARYRGRGLALEDLEQVAHLGLVKASHRYDPSRGHSFMAFCVPTVRGEVRRHFRDRGWFVRPPRAIQELQQTVLAAQTELGTLLKRAPTVPELAASVGAAESAVREALAGRGAFAPASLDREAGRDTSPRSTVGDLLIDPADHRQAAEARVVLGPALRGLSARDRHILRLRFVEGLTQREIAEDIDVTQMQVSRLLARIFRDLRDLVGPLEDPFSQPS